MPLASQIQTEILSLIESMEQTGLLKEASPQRLPQGELVAAYSSSWRRCKDGVLFLVKTPDSKVLVTIDINTPFQGERIKTDRHHVGLHPLSKENAVLLRETLPFTAPAKLPSSMPSFGCGDRLGLANPGHLRLLRAYKVAPVLAQQSIRELSLTGRTYGQVVDAATWAVFQEGYEHGFGADGDHLKTLDEVKMVLAAGASMVTLDLSLYLGKADARCGSCPAELAVMAEQPFSARGVEVRVTGEDVTAFWQTYGAAISFVTDADAACRSIRGEGLYDLEVSVDETAYTTRPVDHLLLAFELQRRGLKPFSVAPCFPGEFQKAIDYLGNLDAFEAEFRIHAAIANHFGYKVSIHSGSDKFAIFPTAARLSEGCFHEKTAGTSWLEALRVAAQKDQTLFRCIYERAKGFFPEAKKYYHIMTELAQVPAIDAMADSGLVDLLSQDAPRQFLHITYGQILQTPELGPPLLALLHKEESVYYDVLANHFRRHVEGLQIPLR